MSFSQLRPTQLRFARLTQSATRSSWMNTVVGRRYMSQDVGRDFMTGEAVAPPDIEVWSLTFKFLHSNFPLEAIPTHYHRNNEPEGASSF